MPTDPLVDRDGMWDDGEEEEESDESTEVTIDATDELETSMKTTTNSISAETDPPLAPNIPHRRGYAEE